MTKTELIKKLEAEQPKARGAWQKGVYLYAFEMLNRIEDENIPFNNVKRYLLGGAADFEDYSYGARSLISNQDIAFRLCNKTELKLTDNGRKEPNKNETWLQVQARALYQAYLLIASHVTR